MNKTIWALALLLSALVTPALATETLTCTDEEVVGIQWQSGKSERLRGNGEKYVVEIISPTSRRFSYEGKSQLLVCREAWAGEARSPTICTDESGMWSWSFRDDNFTRSNIFGVPVGGPGLVFVGHGTCTKG